MKKVTVTKEVELLCEYSSITFSELTLAYHQEFDLLSLEAQETAYLKVEKETEHYKYDPEPTVTVKLYMVYQRLETDEELVKRKAESVAASLTREERERKEFERLSKKFI